MLIQKTSIEWVTQNPVLSSDDLGQEFDTLLIKRGNGVDPWNSLFYDQTISVAANGYTIVTPAAREAFAKIGGQVRQLDAPTVETPPSTALYPDTILYPDTTLYPST